MITMTADTFNPDAFIEQTYVEGSGYGWAIAEKPGVDAWVTVLLLNEEGQALGILRHFHTTATAALEKFTGFLTMALEIGNGPTIQNLTTPI